MRKRASFLCAPTVKWEIDDAIVPNDPRGDALDSDFLCYKVSCANDQKREITINASSGNEESRPRRRSCSAPRPSRSAGRTSRAAPRACPRVPVSVLSSRESRRRCVHR